MFTALLVLALGAGATEPGRCAGAFEVKAYVMRPMRSPLGGRVWDVGGLIHVEWHERARMVNLHWRARREVTGVQRFLREFRRPGDRINGFVETAAHTFTRSDLSLGPVARLRRWAEFNVRRLGPAATRIRRVQYALTPDDGWDAFATTLLESSDEGVSLITRPERFADPAFVHAFERLLAGTLAARPGDAAELAEAVRAGIARDVRPID